MKHKRTVLALSVLATIGIIAFFIFRVNRPTLEVTVRTVPLEKYTGPQTVEALMEAFDEKYDRPSLDKQVDEKYPHAEWLAILLDKGFMFGDFGDYSGLMSVRWILVHFEESGQWRLGVKGVPHTDDWETFKDAYIDRQIWEEQQIQAARQIDPDVFGGLFTGPDGRIYLPGRANRVYVERGKKSAFFYGTPLTEKQQWGITLLGIHPKGYEIIYIDKNGTILSRPPRPLLLPRW